MCPKGLIICHYTEFMRKVPVLVILFLSFNFLLSGQSFITEKILTVLDKPDDTMMREYFIKLTDYQFALRDSLLSTLRSAADWDMRAEGGSAFS